MHFEFFYFYIICGPSVGGVVVVLSLSRFDYLRAQRAVFPCVKNLVLLKEQIFTSWQTDASY